VGDAVSKKKTIALLLAGAVVGAILAVVAMLVCTRCSDSADPSHREVSETSGDHDSSQGSAPGQIFEERSFSRPLSGPCVLTGYVTDEADSPLSGAHVTLRVLDEPWPSATAPRSAVTTQTGQFTLKDLPEDMPFQVWAYAPGKASAAAQDIRCGESFRIALPEGVTLSVTVTAPEGTPHANAVLRVAGTDLWPAREAQVPINEAVNIDGLAEGDYVLWAEAPELAGASPSLVRVSRRQENKIRIDLLKTPSTKIRVLDAATEEPIPKAAAILSSASIDFIKRMSLTDNKGEAWMGSLPTDALVATAMSSNYNTTEPKAALSGQTVELRLARGATAIGVVLDSEDQPLAGAVVSVEAEFGSGSALLPQGDGSSFKKRIAQAAADGLPRMTWLSGALIAGPPHLPLPRVPDEGTTQQGTFVTDEAGRFRLSGLPSGQLELRVRHPEQVMTGPGTISLEPGQTREDLILRMRPGCTAQVRVVDDRGFPLSNAEVTAYDTRDILLERMAVTKDGYAQISGLPSNFRLEATAEGTVPRVVEGWARLGGRVELEMSLPPADSELRGQVIDRNGTGIPDAEITARAVTRGLAQVLVGQSAWDGSFSLPGAGTGAYHITADPGERGRKAKVPQVTSQEYIKLIIDSFSTEVSTQPQEKPTGKDIIVEPIPLREPLDFEDPLGSAGRPSTLDKSPSIALPTSSSSDTLPVTGPPVGRGSLPISLGGSGGKVVITNVSPGSHAEAAGLAKGQKLRAIDGKPVGSASQAKQALGGPIGTVVMLEVEDEEGPFNVVVQRVRVSGH
jgi:protocatechuate 3,4-dioxygenase beta subunit